MFITDILIIMSIALLKQIHIKGESFDRNDSRNTVIDEESTKKTF